MPAAERAWPQQFGTGNRDVVRRGQRIGRKVGAVVDLGGLLRRQEVVCEAKHLRRRPRRVAGGRVDPHALEIIAGAVDQIAVLVELEIAATGVAVDAIEHWRAVAEAAGLLHREEAVAVDRHESRDRRRLHVTLHRVGRARLRRDASGELRGQRGLRDQVEERGIDALEGGRLRVGDVAGDVFECVRSCAQATDRRRESAEDTHDIFSNSIPGGWQSERWPHRWSMSQGSCQETKRNKIMRLKKTPRPFNRGTIAGPATIAGKEGRF